MDEKLISTYAKPAHSQTKAHQDRSLSAQLYRVVGLAILGLYFVALISACSSLDELKESPDDRHTIHYKNPRL